MHQKKTGWLQSWFGVQDMTVGRPMDSLVRFSIPLLVGNLAQQLYNTVDSIVVGQYIGDTALAAVGTAGPILNLLLVLFMGIATGASILSAQYFGAHDRETLSRVVGASILLTVISGLFMTFVGYSLSPWLMSLVSPPADVLEGAVVYLRRGVQHSGRCAARTGRQPDAADLSAGGQPSEHRAGHSVRQPVPHGRSGRGLGDHYRAGRVRSHVSGSPVPDAPCGGREPADAETRLVHY